MIGSYPTHLTFAFVHAEHAGSCWSQRFFRTRHRLHADTLRNADVAVALERGGEDGVDAGSVSSRVRFNPAPFGDLRDDP